MIIKYKNHDYECKTLEAVDVMREMVGNSACEFIPDGECKALYDFITHNELTAMGFDCLEFFMKNDYDLKYQELYFTMLVDRYALMYFDEKNATTCCENAHFAETMDELGKDFFNMNFQDSINDDRMRGVIESFLDFEAYINSAQTNGYFIDHLPESNVHCLCPEF